jgi:N-acetylglucosamine-6-phosphate deacetylase
MNTFGELVDLHIHGIEEKDTTSDKIDDIIQIAKFQKAHGVSAVVLSIYPGNIDTMRKQIGIIREAAEKIHQRKVRKSADIIGVHLEGPFINQSRAGALDSQFFLPPSIDALKQILDGYEDFVKIITVAPELKGAPELMRYSRDNGIHVNMGHSNATLIEAMEGKNAGAQGITHLFNAMQPFHHREPGLAGFGLMDKDTYVEVVADGVHLNLNTLKLVFSVKPHDKIIVVSDSVSGKRSEDRVVYREDGVIEGSGITLKDAADFLVEKGFDPHSVGLAVSSNPLRYIS